MSPANKRLEELLSGKKPEDRTDGDGADDGADSQDERGAAGAQPKPDALSQESEQGFNKSFSERPEWGQAMKIARQAGPEAEKQMRQALRGVYQREQSAHEQVKKLKPQAVYGERIAKVLGDPQAVENSVRLIESFAAGEPAAEEMLVSLLTDFRSRTGKVLSSPDLVKRLESAKADKRDGLITEEQYEAQRQDLLELEQTRKARQQAESRVKERETAEQSKVVEDRAKAFEQAIALGVRQLNDPDFPVIEDWVYAEVNKLCIEEKRQQRELTPERMPGLVKVAVANVKGRLQGFGAKPRSMRPLPEGGGGSSELGEKEPSDPAQAIIWRRERARRGR